MKHLITVLLLITTNFSFGQSSIEFNKEYLNVPIHKSSHLIYKLKLAKNGVYQFSVLQKGIDVVLTLTDKSNNKILDKDSPNGQNGLERFEYSPAKTNDFLLLIKRLEEAGNSDSGKVNIFIKKLSPSDIQLKQKIKKELEVENKKNVQTLDIDHFWEAFDNLKNCKSHTDSVESFQKLYIDRATDGFIAFMKVRDHLNAETFVNTIARLPKFYNSIRKNTYEVKKAEPLIEEVFRKFKEIYPNFKPFKVCFAIGVVRTGGTVSDKYVLVGTEIATSTKDVDLSEFNNNSLGKVLAYDKDIVQSIKNMVAHECVHTQQKFTIDTAAIKCELLYKIMQEGFCNFIGELITGGNINSMLAEYGDKHEKQLWAKLKNELCSENTENWLYNYVTAKDKPADLGYYMGYKIAQEYYKNAADKKQAIVDIIEMNNPVKFLELSKYDQKEKQ